MKKKLSLLMVALMAIAAFAGLRRASTALLDYPTSQAGITVSGTTTFDAVKINSNATTVNGIKFANGYTSAGELSPNVATLSVEGGFKTGDVVTIAGAFNNSDDTKTSKIDLFTVDGEGHITVLFTTAQFVNGRTQAADPVPETYTLLADADKLYLGRNGNTGTFVTLLTVTREAGEGGGGEPAAQEVTMQYSGSTTTNMTGENDAALVGLDATEWSVVGAKGSSSNLPGLNKEGTIRLYGHADGGNTVTVSSLNNATINSITLDLKASNNNIYVKVGDNTITETDGKYTINSSSFVLGNANASTTQVHINSVKINYVPGEAPAVAAPTFSPAAGTYTGAQQVEIACATEEAKIYYTTDGSEPTATSTEYTAAIDIAATTTVKAIAIKGEDKSKIATATYTIIEKIDGGSADAPLTIAQAKELIDTKEAAVLAHPDNKVYVKGKISQIDSFNETFGSIQYWISEDGTTTDQFEVYSGLGLNGAKFTAKEDVVVGADVVVVGNIKKYNTTYEFDKENQQVSYVGPAKDVTLAATDITEGNITAAYEAASKGYTVANLTITLAEGNYTITKSLVAGGNITINGNGAIIDASALEANMIQWIAKAENTEWTKADVAISGVTVKGLKKALFYSNSKNYYGDFTLINSFIEQAADAITFDYTKGSVAVNLTVTGSTIYAPTATTKSLYSSQSAQKATEAPDVEVQTFKFAGNTMYNLAKGKNFFTHRQANQKWLAYDVQGNIFVNCGKSGQTIKGMNGGQSGVNPIWTIKGNVFNFDGADTSAAEATDDAEEPVQESIAGIITFTDAANGDFTQSTAKVGDPRWILYSVTILTDAIQNGAVVADVAAAKAGETVTLTATPAEGYAINAYEVKNGDKDVTVANNKFTMPAGDVTVGATFRVAPVDVEIAATDITEGDITAAIAAKAGEKTIKNLAITLAANTAYKVTATMKVEGNVTITGAAGATIDASALLVTEGESKTYNPFIQMNPFAADATVNEKGACLIDGITIKDVTITDLPAQLIYGNKQKYLMSKILVENSVIGINGTAKKTIFDFNGGGNASEIIVNNSTLWANPSNEQNGGLFSSQSGHGSIQDLGSDKQLFAITNSTIYNIAYGRTTNSQRRNNTAGMEYKVENSIIVNSGKNGQFIVGLNGGSANSAQTYTASNNVFNFDNVEVSAAEETKVKEKIAEFTMTSINGVVAFTDAANGDFNGDCALAIDVTAPAGKVGDPRWTIKYQESPFKTLWTSTEAVALTWDTGVDVEKANTDIIQVGDVIHVAVEGVTASESAWSAQVALYDQQGTQLENGIPVGTGTVTDAAIVVTGDMLALIKANGLKISGNGYSTKLVTVERGVYAGSKKSIWLGDATLTWTQASVTKFHFINANVAVDQIIKLTYEATGNPNIQFRYGWGSEEVYGEPTYGEGYATLAVSAAAVDILKDKGLIINAAGIRLTQIELLPAPPVDIEISPAEGDIAAALKIETDKVETVGKITINLKENVTYTVGTTLVAPSSITIKGNGATIDASALDANLIEFAAKDAEDTEWTNADVAITAVTVKGLKKALFYSAGKYYYGNFTLMNSFIEQAADATTFDYTKGSTALNFTIAGSTIYAPTATTKSLYSSQGGQKATEYNADATQNFLFSLNTMYNLAKGKNFFSHRQSNQKWLSYTVQSNLFVNCGKSGQVIKGMNGGQGGANPTWTIKGNAFNFDGADTSANEETGDADEPVKDNVAGVMTFTNVETPDFGGTFEMPFGATAPEALGDNRWTITFTNAATGVQTVKAEDLENATIYTIAGQRVEKAQKGLYIINGKKVVIK